MLQLLHRAAANVLPLMSLLLNAISRVKPETSRQVSTTDKAVRMGKKVSNSQSVTFCPVNRSCQWRPVWFACNKP